MSCAGVVAGRGSEDNKVDARKWVGEELYLLSTKKIVLDFQKGKAVGPVAVGVKSGETQEGNKDSVGELSVTLVDARKLSYIFYGKTIFCCIFF